METLENHEDKAQNNRPKSLDALKRRVRKIWIEIERGSVKKQVKTMKKRRKSIIASGGEWTPN